MSSEYKLRYLITELSLEVLVVVVVGVEVPKVGELLLEDVKRLDILLLGLDFVVR